jgi:hypothetical protein
MSDRIAGLVWVDFTGRTRLTIIKAGTDPCTIASAMQLLSNSAILYSWDGFIDPTLGSSLSGQYQAVNTAASLMFQTDSGSVLSLTFPAPLISVFKADKITIDPSLITSIITAAIGNLSDGNGNLASSYLGGVLEKTRSDITPIG